MLDTRDLAKSDVSNLSLLLVNGGHLQLRKVGRTSIFEWPKHVCENEMNDKIRQLFYISDTRRSGTFRNIVLVGHGLRQDLITIRRRGVECLNIPTVVAKIDTLYMSKMVLGRWGSLTSLLDDKIPYAKLHNAGNDAQFTLQALLLLAYVSTSSSASRAVPWSRMQVLKKIARARLPELERRNEEERAKEVANKLGYINGDHVLASLEEGFAIFARF